MNNQFQRAKSKENKLIRMQEIMNVTDHLFKTHTYHDITLTIIAKELGMARGGLYKYVSSKEEIFLQIYLHKQKETVDTIVNLMKENEKSIASLANIISLVFFKHLDYIKYHQILNAIIETNVSIEKLADFKIESYKIREPLLKLIMEVCQLESLHNVSDLYLMIIYHSVYLYDRVAYSNEYTQAMKLANLEIVEIDFQESLSHFIEMCLTHYY